MHHFNWQALLNCILKHVNIAHEDCVQTHYFKHAGGSCQIGAVSLFYSSDQRVVSAALVNTATRYRKRAGNVSFQGNERATRAAACQAARVHELRPNNDAHLLQSDSVEAVVLQ